MSEGCRECAYQADEIHCGLYCRFLDAQGECRCFHREGEPFVSRKIEREMSDIEKRLLRAQTPDFKEVRMIWLNNIWLIEDPLLYNVHDMGISWGALAGAFLAPFLYGLYWKRTTKAAVWVSFIFSTVLMKRVRFWIPGTMRAAHGSGFP